MTRWPHILLLDPYSAGLALARRMIPRGARVTVFVEPQESFVARSRGVISRELFEARQTQGFEIAPQ